MTAWGARGLHQGCSICPRYSSIELTLLKGYIDFETYNEYRGLGVYYYWSAATILSIVVMSAGLAYIVVSPVSFIV